MSVLKNQNTFIMPAKTQKTTPSVSAFRLNLNDYHHPEKAQEMARYMKNRFSFIGLARPDLKSLSLSLIKDSKRWDNQTFFNEILYYFHLPQREYQYLAITLIETNYKRFTWDEWQTYLFPLFGSPKDSFAWWDSVDGLRKPLGLWLKLYPEHLTELVEQFQNDDSFWKRRVAITVQLQYKEKTKTDLLTQSILYNLNDPEFFIQKGIGWALREYSKTNPQWVKRFLSKHAFSKLASKEASKYLS